VGLATNLAKISAESRAALRTQCGTKKNGEINQRLHMMELNFERHKRSIVERKARYEIQGLDSNRLEPIDNTLNVPVISEVGDCIWIVRDWARFILRRKIQSFMPALADDSHLNLREYDEYICKKSSSPAPCHKNSSSL
jgi:hypothetical protein